MGGSLKAAVGNCALPCIRVHHALRFVRAGVQNEEVYITVLGPWLRNEGAQGPCPDCRELPKGVMQAAAECEAWVLTVARAPGCARLLHAMHACSAGMGERAPELLACNPQP